MAGKSPRVSVTLSAGDLELLEQLATKQQRSVSWIAARAIRFFLSETRRGSQLVLDFEKEGEQP